MLAKENRLKTAGDFKGTVRAGRRYVTASLVTYVNQQPQVDDTVGCSRFGFIVSKKVGGAVQRNTVRRRLRAVCAELRPRMVGGKDVVIRVLPPASAQPYAVLYDEVSRSLARGSVLQS